MDERYIDVSYDEDNGLRLADVFAAIGRHLFACLLSGAIVAGAFLAYTMLRMEPQYQSSFTVYVSNRPATEDLPEESEYATPYYLGAGDVDASTSLAYTYAFIFESGEMVQSAVQHVNLDSYEERALDRELVSTSIEQTAPLVTVTVTADSPEDAFQIATALLELIPDRASSIASGSSVSVIEPAQLPSRQSSPSNRLNAILGFVLGFSLSALVVVILSDRDKLVRDVDELEGRFGIPAIVKSQDVLPFLPRHSTRTIGIMDADDGSLAAADAVTIAESFVARGARVLLIDGDADNAGCRKLLDAGQAAGLSDILDGGSQPADVIQHLTERGMDFIAPGRRVADYAIRVRSERMESFLAGLEKDYDCVVVAIPPLLSDDSALVLADVVGRAFLSVCAGKTRKPHVAEAMRRLNLADVRIVGFMYGASRKGPGRLAVLHR